MPRVEGEGLHAPEVVDAVGGGVCVNASVTYCHLLVCLSNSLGRIHVAFVTNIVNYPQLSVELMQTCTFDLQPFLWTEPHDVLVAKTERIKFLAVSQLLACEIRIVDPVLVVGQQGWCLYKFYCLRNVVNV